MLIDTHGHVNFNAFKDDSKETLQRALDQDIWVVMPGSQYDTSKRAVELAEQYEKGVYAAIGLHPVHLGEKRHMDVSETQSASPDALTVRPWMAFHTKLEEFDKEQYKQLVLSSSKGKVVAIGEIGLDYYREPAARAKQEEYRNHQKEILQHQLDLAEELKLPVILHCRAAHDDMYEIVTIRRKIQPDADLRGVMHSFTGTAEQANKFISRGLYIGLNGLIFKDVPALPDPKEVIGSIPLEHIVLETDSPYLVPPAAGAERNEPSFVTYVAAEIAKIKNVDVEKVARVTTKNAKTLFRI